MSNASGARTLPAAIETTQATAPLRPVRAADWILRFAIVLYAAGLAVALITRNSSSIGDLALMRGVSADQIFLFEKLGGALILAAALSLLIYPTTGALILIAGLVFAEAYAGRLAGGYAFFEYTPFAEALRYLTPLALLPLIASHSVLPSEKWRRTAAAWILRIGLATVFFMHGLEALWQSPRFIDFILSSARNVLDVSLAEATAIQLLRVIGWVDVAVALLVLIRPSRPLLAWLCFWGLVTALARPISLGFASYPEVLLRASHFLAPIALWWLTLRTADEREDDPEKASPSPADRERPSV